VSSYQGGREYFKYMIDPAQARRENIRCSAAARVIVADEIRELQAYGVYASIRQDGQMGLQGMINDMLASCDEDLSQHAPRT
jgi:methylmalonyl-CoA mutase